MEFYVGLAFASMVFFAINAIILKAAKGIDAITLTLISFAVSTVVMFLYWLLMHRTVEISMHGAGFAILFGITNAAALLFFVMALSRGNVGIVTTIIALNAGLAALMAMLLLNEHLSLLKFSGVVLGVIAALLLAW